MGPDGCNPCDGPRTDVILPDALGEVRPPDEKRPLKEPPRPLITVAHIMHKTTETKTCRRIFQQRNQKKKKTLSKITN